MTPRSFSLIHAFLAGKSAGLTRDDILDNITIAWLTNTAILAPVSIGRIGAKSRFFNAKGVSIPVAVSVFPDELYPVPRSWAERAYSQAHLLQQSR